MRLFPDYQYRALVCGQHARRDRLLNVTSPCLNEVASAFLNNIARTDSFCLFAADVAAQALQTQLWRDSAVVKITGKLPTRERQYNAATERKIATEIARLDKLQHNRFMRGKDNRDKRRVTVGVDYINHLLSTSYGANQSLRAMLFSTVVESWIAFETLAADLWYTALDYGPADWRTQTFLKRSDFNKGSNDEQSIPLPSDIPDPHKRFGSLLRATDSVSFQKLLYIRRWYKTAFGKAVEPLFKKTFDGYTIAQVAAVRNVIIHKAGHADARYLESVQQFPDLSIELGKPIQLDGEKVRKLRNTAIVLAQELVLFIDGKLAQTAKPSGQEEA